MKWINYFFYSRIPFYIYKLNKGDSIIYTTNISINKLFIILHGIVYKVKSFTNKETITLAILDSNNIIYIDTEYKNCYYQITAITDTFLLSFKWNNLIQLNEQIKSIFFTELLQSYTKTVKKYEIMNNILAHKHIKNRVTQLILFFSREFGIISKKQIIIPYYISQKTMSVIIGSNRTNINKILHYLESKKLIQYLHNKKICIENPFFFIYFDNIKN